MDWLNNKGTLRVKSSGPDFHPSEEMQITSHLLLFSFFLCLFVCFIHQLRHIQSWGCSKLPWLGFTNLKGYRNAEQAYATLLYFTIHTESACLSHAAQWPCETSISSHVLWEPTESELNSLTNRGAFEKSSVINLLGRPSGPLDNNNRQHRTKLSGRTQLFLFWHLPS